MKPSKGHVTPLHMREALPDSAPSEHNVSGHLLPETWDNISWRLDRRDLVNLARTCRKLHNTIGPALHDPLRDLIFEREITAPMMHYVLEDYQNEYRRRALHVAAIRQRTLRISITWSPHDDQVRLLIGFLKHCFP